MASFPPSSWKGGRGFLGSGGAFANPWKGMGKGASMAEGLPLPEGREEGDHDLCPSPPEKWKSVDMVTPSMANRIRLLFCQWRVVVLILLSERRSEGGTAGWLCLLLFLFQSLVGVAIASDLLILRKRGAMVVILILLS